MIFAQSLFVFFFLIPGISFFLSYFQNSQTDRQYFTDRYINGIFWYPFLAIFCYILHLLHIYLPLGALIILAVLGWKREFKKWSWSWLKVFYSLGIIGCLAPLVHGQSIPDIFNYQLRFPRDVFRFGISAIDGTSFYHAYFNYHHLFLSSFWFSESFINSIAVSSQFICLIFILDIMKKSFHENKWLWITCILSVPLFIILSLEAMIDILCVFMLTTVFVNLFNKKVLSFKIAFIFGLLFTFKLTLFILIIPIGFWAFLKSQNKTSLVVITSLPIVLYATFQWIFTGIPLFPISLYFFGEPFMQEAFSICREIINTNFHVSNQSVTGVIESLVWRIHPLIVLIIFPLINRSREAFLLMLSTILWWAIFPQDRFFLYLLPIFLIVIGNHLPKNKLLIYGCWICTLTLLFFRSGGSYFNYFSRTFDREQKFQTSSEYKNVIEFSSDLSMESVVYIERGVGWYLPGRVIISSPYQCRWTPSKKWLPQMELTGVTHLLIRKDNKFVADFYPKVRYHDKYKKIELEHKNRINEALKSCQLINQNDVFFLYQMPERN